MAKVVSKAKSSKKTKVSKAKVTSGTEKKTSSKIRKSPEKSLSDEYLPSAKEIANGLKVLSILENIEDIGYMVEREDLFVVIEPELNLEIIVDAEEEVICFLAEICEVKHLEENVANWAFQLLELNNKFLHGAFSIYQGKVFLRENLASENLDANEVEDALSAMFTAIIRHAETLKLV